MARTDPIPHKQTRFGDAAVSGLFGGLAAGLAMAAFLAAAALAAGTSPAAYLSDFSAAPDGSAWLGLITHLSVSAVYGTFYGLFHHLVDRLIRVHIPGWLLGLFYGAVLLTVASLVILPGLQSSLQAIPSLAFALAHLVYGLALGLSVKD